MTKTFELDGLTYIVLKTSEEADEHVSDDAIESALGWFSEKRGVPQEEFMDRLCPGMPAWDGSKPGFEIEDFSDAAAKRILSRARKIKREMDESL